MDAPMLARMDALPLSRESVLASELRAQADHQEEMGGDFTVEDLLAWLVRDALIGRASAIYGKQQGASDLVILGAVRMGDIVSGRLAQVLDDAIEGGRDFDVNHDSVLTNLMRLGLEMKREWGQRVPVPGLGNACARRARTTNQKGAK